MRNYWFDIDSYFYTYKRGVKFRNIFIPQRGPCVSPAPNSICVHTDNISHFSQTSVWQSVKETVIYGILYKMRLCVCVVPNQNGAYLSPPLRWSDFPQGQVNSAASVSIVCWQGARQNGCVICGERSLQENTHDNRQHTRQPPSHTRRGFISSSTNIHLKNKSTRRRSDVSPLLIVICASCWFPHEGHPLQPRLRSPPHIGQRGPWHQYPR